MAPSAAASLGDRSQSQQSLVRLTHNQVIDLASDLNEEMLRRKMQTSFDPLLSICMMID
jgi:hypothetical protein